MFKINIKIEISADHKSVQILIEKNTILITNCNKNKCQLYMKPPGNVFKRKQNCQPHIRYIEESGRVLVGEGNMENCNRRGNKKARHYLRKLYSIKCGNVVLRLDKEKVNKQRIKITSIVFLFSKV